MHHKLKHVARGALFLVAAAALGGVVMLLWNYVVPIAFAGGQPIDYWHALALLVLTRILFGGFRGHGHGGWHGRREQWEKWQAMTKEERAEFIELRRAEHHRPWGGRARRGAPE